MALYPLSAFRAMSKAADLAYETLAAEGTILPCMDALHTREDTYAVIDYHKAEEMHAQLTQISSVASVNVVDSSAPIAHLMVLPHDGKPILTEISAFVRQSDFPVEEIRAEQGHLDEVFRSMTISS